MSNELVTLDISEFDDEAHEINVLMSKSINMADSATVIASDVKKKINSQVYVDDAGVQWSFDRWWNEKITCGVTIDAINHRLYRLEGPTKVVADRRAEKAVKQTTPKQGVNFATGEIPPKTDVDLGLKNRSKPDLETADESQLPRAGIGERPHVIALLRMWGALSLEEKQFCMPQLEITSF